MTSVCIRGTSREDLLAIPAVALGFHPSDSVVILALEEGLLRLTGRVCLDWHRTHYDDTVAQISAVVDELSSCSFVLIGYGEGEQAARSVRELADVVGPHAVLDALVVEDGRYWSLDGDEGPRPFLFEDSSVAAQAVFGGLVIAGSREEAIAPVMEHRPAPRASVRAARREAAAMSPGEAMARTRLLMETEGELSEGQALLLAMLLADGDRMAAVLTGLKTATADRAFGHLTAARRVAPRGSTANVLALLAVACWLSGRGAAQTACLDQLVEVAPGHPVSGLLARLHRQGIPPGWWDE
ncbi:MAG: DUF4192 domain-containing protein [Arachnia sp.]